MTVPRFVPSTVDAPQRLSTDQLNVLVDAINAQAALIATLQAGGGGGAVPSNAGLTDSGLPLLLEQGGYLQF